MAKAAHDGKEGSGRNSIHLTVVVHFGTHLAIVVFVVVNEQTTNYSPMHMVFCALRKSQIQVGC